MKTTRQSNGVTRTTDEARVVVCIPAFNEEKSIAKVMLKAREFADVIIVCDDGSTDMTGEIARALGATVLAHDHNMGKGAALATLFREAKSLSPKVVVTMDGDGQHDPSEIPLLDKPVLDGKADIAIGVRRMEGFAPGGRIVGNKVLDAMTSAKAGMDLHDTQSGFRAYSPVAIERIDFRQRGMAVESQTLIDAASSGLRIAEVLVSVSYEGMKAKRNPVSHLSQVLDYLITSTVADSPILYLGLPGLVILVLGVIAGFRVLDIFAATRQIAVGTGLIGVALLIIGTIMMATSLILKFLLISDRRRT